MPPSTAEILARRALQKACGGECVDWAIAMLERGYDSRSLRILAGTDPPFNHFELAELRDKALDDIGASREPENALTTFAAEILRSGLAGERRLWEAVVHVKDLCIEADYARELYPFYLLAFAAEDLEHEPVQWYWEGADRSNIDRIIREQARIFVEKHGAEDHVQRPAV
jgi:hypothetical protein